jgi:hypothetical protein
MEHRGDAGFVEKRFDVLGVFAELRKHRLDGARTIDASAPRKASGKDFAHAAFRDELQNRVRADVVSRS